MAELADIIAGAAGRRQAQTDRPAQILRQWEQDAQQESLIKSRLATEEQGREETTKAGVRAEAQETRAQDLHSGEVSKQKQLLEAGKIRNRTANMEYAQKYVAPRVDQVIEYNNIFTTTGDPNAKLARDKGLDLIVTEEAFRVGIGFLPQYHELINLQMEHLYNPDVTPDAKEQDLQELFGYLGMQNQAYQNVVQNRAAKARAAQVLTKRQMSGAEQAGKVVGAAEGLQEVQKRGLPVEKPTVSEGQQARAQKTYANFLTNTVLKEAGANAGKAWFDKNLDKDGTFQAGVAGMPAEMYTKESPMFQSFFEVLLGSGFEDKKDADKDAAIDRILASDTFALESPFRAKLEDLKDVKLKNLRDVQAFKSKSIL